MDIELYKATLRERIKTNTPVPLTDELIEAYLEILRFKQVKKRQYLIQPGFPNLDQIYIFQGTVRVFFIDNEGREQTTQFAIEDWFISDVESYLTGNPASFYAEALEDSIVALISRTAFDALCDQYPKWERVARILLMRGFAYAQRRMRANLQKSAEERYLDFVRNYGEIEQRVPRHALASYLNMTQEYLSKLRKKMARG